MDDISPEILINPRLRGVHEQYYRAQWFVQNALVASDLATRFRLLITAIYPARAIVELMLEAAEQQELKPFLDPDSKKSRKSFEETLVPVLPYYHLIEKIRICRLSEILGSCPLLVIVEREISCAADVHPGGRSRACSTRQAATPV